MAIAQIDHWLKTGKDYAFGVEIYLEHGTSFLLKKEFKKGPDAYNIKKLEIELMALRSNKVAEAVDASAPDSQVNIGEIDSKPRSPEPYHNKLLEVRNIRKSKYKQVNHLHASLSHIDTDEERKKVAFEILNLWDDINESWAVEDKFLETGVFTPPSETELPTNPVVLSRMLSNARANITKAKKKLNSAENLPHNEKEILEKKTHLQHHIDLKNKIEEKLNSYE